MRSKKTITIETIREVRILHDSPRMAALCPFCGRETQINESLCREIECRFIGTDELGEEPQDNQNGVLNDE